MEFSCVLRGLWDDTEETGVKRDMGVVDTRLKVAYH